MLMEHFLCDDVGGKHNMCGMDTYLYSMVINFNILFPMFSKS